MEAIITPKTGRPVPHGRLGTYTNYGCRCGLCRKAWADQAKKWRRANPECHARQQRVNRLKGKYGLSVEDYQRMEELQSGVCAICQQPETVIDGKTGKVRSLSVDHDHKTGKVRALLCAGCNQAIGLLKEDPELFNCARDYLLNHQS